MFNTSRVPLSRFFIIIYYYYELYENFLLGVIYEGSYEYY